MLRHEVTRPQLSAVPEGAGITRGNILTPYWKMTRLTPTSSVYISFTRSKCIVYKRGQGAHPFFFLGTNILPPWQEQLGAQLQSVTQTLTKGNHAPFITIPYQAVTWILCNAQGEANLCRLHQLPSTLSKTMKEMLAEANLLWPWHLV